MSEPAQPLPRVRITAQTALEGARPRTEALELPDVYSRSLIRSQRRIALACLFAFIALTVLLVLGVYAFPGLGQLHIAGMPLSWLLLGLGVYPIILATALIYARAASRNERSFLELTNPDAPRR